MTSKRAGTTSTEEVLHRTRARRWPWLLFGVPIMALAFAPESGLGPIGSLLVLLPGSGLVALGMLQLSEQIIVDEAHGLLVLRSRSLFQARERRIGGAEIEAIAVVPCGYAGDGSSGGVAFRAEARLVGGERVTVVECAMVRAADGGHWEGAPYHVAAEIGRRLRVLVVDEDPYANSG